MMDDEEWAWFEPFNHLATEMIQNMHSLYVLVYPSPIKDSIDLNFPFWQIILPFPLILWDVEGENDGCGGSFVADE